jgi:hypothetical protein
MAVQNNQNIYDITITGLTNKSNFLKNAKKAIDEISSVVGQGHATKITLKPSESKKNCFNLSIFAMPERESLLISKTGRNINSLLKSTKRSIIKRSRQIHSKKIKFRRKSFRSKWNNPLFWQTS